MVEVSCDDLLLRTIGNEKFQLLQSVSPTVEKNYSIGYYIGPSSVLIVVNRQISN